MALVSVITVVKNDALGLRATLSSLAQQDYSHWEVLIVVGKSTDSTLLTANELASQDLRVRVIEQSGLGIYGAMNQGIDNAKGEFFWFMNAGDTFADPDVLGGAVAEIESQDVGLLIGGYRLDGGNNQRAYSYPRARVSEFDFAFTRRGGCHQAMLFKAKSVIQSGGFNEQFSVASDFELVLKIIKSDGAMRLPKIYAAVEPGGAADQGIFEVHRQKHRIRMKVMGRSPLVLLMSFGWTLGAGAKIILRKVLLRFTKN